MENKELEIEKLADMLYDKGIPFQMMPMKMKMLGKGAIQIHYPKAGDDCIYDFVYHDFSYGHEDGLLEMMDHNTNEVVGNLTAQDAFDFIFYDYVDGDLVNE